jgi:AraC-like DNA-binding protein
MATAAGATFTDAEDFVGSFQEARIELVVTSPGLFWARVNRVVLPHLHLVAVRESLPRIAYFALKPQRVCVSFPLRSDLFSVWGGVSLRRGHVVFHSAGERLHQRTNGPTDWGLLSLESKRLIAAGRALMGVHLVAPPAGQILKPARRDIADLLRLHAAAARFAEKQPKLILDPEVIRGMEHDLIEALVRCLAPDDRRDLGGWRSHKQVMDRVEFVLERASATSVPELCATMGVSERTLRSCCAEFLGIGLGRYLRLKRLRLAHVALRGSGFASANVAEVVRRYGFSDLRRFADAYEATFGETPSTTLRRAKQTALSQIFSDFA